MFTGVSTTFKQIIYIAIPLIIGSLGHNIINATDTLVLGQYGKTTELAAIGLAAPLYLLITMVSMAFSRGGQIMIARRAGEGRHRYIGRLVQNMLYFELGMAFLLYLFIKFFGYYFLSLFINTNDLLNACWNFLYYRIDGIFFTFIGIVFIAMYSGLGRTRIIIYNALVVAISNLLLNRMLVFGLYGAPEMGIIGSAIASVIAEGLGLLTFIIYILFIDKEIHKYHLFRIPPFDTKLIKAQLILSAPTALQSLFGMGSWFLFFTLIENLGEQALAASSAVRVIYLFLGVPSWGLGSATVTITSQLIGRNKKDEVFGTLLKIAILSVSITAILCSCLLFMPATLIDAITDNKALIADALPLMSLLYFILIIISISTIFYNGIVGTGAISSSLIIQIFTVFVYVVYAFVVMEVLRLDLLWAWSAEIIFAVLTFFISMWYMQSKRWQSLAI